MPRAVIYARYSSDKQTEQSIEGQLRVCYDYAKANNILIIGEYIDRAKTGKYDDRPEFQRMISDAKTIDINYILVYKLDRFSRNRYDSAVYKHKLKEYGVKVLSACENISDSAEGIILEAVLEASAEYYSVELAEKTKRGLKESALKANSTGGTLPVGYRIENKKLVIDERTKYAPKLVFDLFNEGKSKTEICNALIDRGFLTSKGNKPKISTVDSILRNKKYMGVYHYNGIEIEGGCPAIITKEQFYKAQERLEKVGKKRGEKQVKADYLFGYNLYCGKHNERMVGRAGTSRNGTKYNYYYCSKCKKYIPKQKLEDYVIDVTAEYVLTPEKIKSISEKVVDIAKSDYDNREEINLTKQINKIDSEINKATEMLITTDIDSVRKLLPEKIKAREAEKRALENQLRKLQTTVQLSPKDVEKFLLGLSERKNDDTEYRKNIANIFINSIFYFDDKIIIIYNISKDEKQPTSDDIKKLCEKLCSHSYYVGSPSQKPNKPYYISVNGYFGLLLLR